MMNNENYNYKNKPRIKKEISGNKKVLLIVGFILLSFYGPFLVDYFQSYLIQPDDSSCESPHSNLKNCR